MIKFFHFEIAFENVVVALLHLMVSLDLRYDKYIFRNYQI